MGYINPERGVYRWEGSEAEIALNGSMSSDADARDRAVKSLSTLEYFEDMNASASTKAHLAGVVLKRALATLHAGDS